MKYIQYVVWSCNHLQNLRKHARKKKQFRKIISKLREFLFNSVISIKDIGVCSRICLAVSWHRLATGTTTNYGWNAKSKFIVIIFLSRGSPKKHQSTRVEVRKGERRHCRARSLLEDQRACWFRLHLGDSCRCSLPHCFLLAVEQEFQGYLIRCL